MEEYSQCGSRGQGSSPSGEEPVRELELRKAERAWGLGLRLGWGPFGEPGEISCSPGAMIPLESLGLVEVPGAREQKAEPSPTLGNRTCSLRTSGEVPGGPTIPFVMGCPHTHAVAGDSTGPGQLPLQRCAGLPQSRAQLAPTKEAARSSGEVRVGTPGWKENNRPHSVSLAPLTSLAHPAEILPQSPAPGPGHPRRWEARECRSRIPRRYRPRNPRSCSLGAQQRRPRYRRHCRPRWMSSHTWGQRGRHLLSLPFGLVLESCGEWGMAVPIPQMRKLRLAKTTLRARDRAGIQTPVHAPADAATGKGKVLTLR